jgi:AcrR family transcriptional regulator
VSASARIVRRSHQVCLVPRVLSPDDVSSFRERLCQTAERRFAEHGPDSVTMRQLAADLGCSPMTPYRYFKDKDEILGAVRAAAFDRFADALEGAFQEKPDLDPAARSLSVGQAYVRFALAEPHAYRLMFDLTQPREDAYPELKRTAARARATMTEHLQGVVGDDNLKINGPVLGHIYWASIHGVLMLHLAGKLGPEVQALPLIEAMMRTIGAGVRAQN